MDTQPDEEKSIQVIHQVHIDVIDDFIIKADQAAASGRVYAADEYYQPTAIAKRLDQWRKRFNKLQYPGDRHDQQLT